MVQQSTNQGNKNGQTIGNISINKIISFKARKGDEI